MHAFLVTLNAFWEDSSVLVVVAYLLTRGRLLALLFPQDGSAKRRSRVNIVLTGLVFGGAAATEYLFPNQRFPYATQTLFVTFATFTSGLPVGLVAGLVVMAGALAAQTPLVGLVSMLAAVGASLAVGQVLRRFVSQRDLGGDVGSLPLSLAAGMLSQAAALTVDWVLALQTPMLRAEMHPYAAASIPANGIGIALLQLIVREAWQRTEADRLRREAAAARAFAAQQQLAALRARVHPHFLFNTLNSIAALCTVAPERAETATVQLGDVMRRALAARPEALTSIDNEIADARAYLEIESYRYGDRLCVEWRIGAEVTSTNIPPFALITLIDNAVNHGIAAQGAGGRLVVTLRAGVGQRVIVAVRDSGVGMSADDRRAIQTIGDRPHGLQLLDEQLRLIFGPRARLRLFSRPGQGTLAVFAIPGTARLEPILMMLGSEARL